MTDLVTRIAEQVRYQYMPAETRAVLDEAASLLRSQAEEIARLRDSEATLYVVLKQALGIVVEFGDLNGFRNLSDAELGRAVTAVARSGAMLLNKLDGAVFDAEDFPPPEAISRARSALNRSGEP